MRFFPRTARRRMLTPALVGVITLGVLAIPAAATLVAPSAAPMSPTALSLTGASVRGDDLKDRLNQTKKAVEKAHAELAESSKRAQRAAAKLAAAKQQLSSARTQLQIAQAQVAEARAEDARLQAALTEAMGRRDDARADLVAGKQVTVEQQQSLSNLVVQTYQEGDPDLLAFASLLDAQEPADLTRGLEARNVIVGEQTRAYAGAQASQILLTVRRGPVRAARDEVAAQRTAAADHLKAMAALESQAAAAEESVERRVGARKNAQADANRAKARDRQTLARARAEQARVAEMLRKRAAAARRAALRRGQSVRVGPSGGLLQRPVPGIVTSAFGYRVHPIYGYYGLHDGTDFRAGCGTAMRAAADGRVISSYYQSAYGNRLIIDHGLVNGTGIATIYNHATRYTVGVGDRVSRGEIVGYVGSTGWSTGCHLHFTVMANGKPVNAANWF